MFTLAPWLAVAADEVVFRDKAGRVLKKSELAEANGNFTWELASTDPVSEEARKEHVLGRAAGQRGDATCSHSAKLPLVRETGRSRRMPIRKPSRMPPSTEALQRLSDFASGKTPVPEFEQQLYNDPDIETLLSEERAPRFCQTGITLFHYLIGLDLSDPGDVLSAKDVLVSLLQKHGVKAPLPAAATAEYALLLDAQPRWLDADVKFLASLLDGAPCLPPKQRKAWLRQRILELFKYAKQPPRWLQSPAWPIGDAGPLVFLGQFPVADYFHDEAAVYVFHDPVKGAFTTFVQIC